MPVYQRRLKAGIKWRFKKDVKGVPLQSGAIYLTRRDAEQAEAAAVARFIETGLRPQERSQTLMVSAPSVIELLEQRIAWVEAHRSARHAKDHRLIFGYFVERVPEWADLPATSITVDMVEDMAAGWVEDLKNRGSGPKLVNDALKLLQATWNRPWSSRRKKREFTDNPFAQAERFAQETRAKYLPTDAQVARLRIVARPEWRLLIEVLLGTGARPDEVIKIQWVDVQVDQEPFSVVLYTQKKRGGHRKGRRVPITGDLAARFRSWRRQNPESHFTFQRTDTETPQPRTYWWMIGIQKKICPAAGVKYFPPHSYRHWWASRLYRDGVDRARIQALLGHENASTTDRYLHEILGLPLET